MSTFIAINSPCFQHGKSTLAKLLVEEARASGLKCEILSFADPLRRMIRALLSECGYSDKDINEIMHGSRKEEPLPELGGHTYRHIITTLGTEWGRTMVFVDLWASITIGKVRRAIAAGTDLVVIDDLRHQNEAALSIAEHAYTIRVTNPRKPLSASKHSSEHDLTGFVFDRNIENGGSFEDLRLKARDVLVCRGAITQAQAA